MPGFSSHYGRLRLRDQTRGLARGSRHATGPTVMIAEVLDVRPFELAPREPSIPSLRDEDIQNTAITSRAIACKRGGTEELWAIFSCPEPNRRRLGA